MGSAATARPTTVAYVNCFDATTFGRTVHRTADEERRLRNVLAALRDYGFIPEASFEPALPDCGFADVADHLRATIGTPIADAALAAAERYVPAGDPAPAAVVPVWPFEPEGGSGDALLSSARLWGVDLLVEALRVEDDPMRGCRYGRSSRGRGITMSERGVGRRAGAPAALFWSSEHRRVVAG